MKHASLLAAAMAAAALIAMTNSAIAQQERIWRPPGGDQVDGDVQLFRQVNFNGPHIRVQTPVRDLGITWPVRSIRVNSGAWQVCTGVNFTGTCRNVTGSQAMVASPLSQVRSISPIVERPTPSPGGAASLRGMAAEFFPRPTGRDGQRVLACRNNNNANMNCASQTAQQFCRGRGYNHIGNVAMETVSGRHYLADVLCRRSAG